MYICKMCLAKDINHPCHRTSWNDLNRHGCRARYDSYNGWRNALSLHTGYDENIFLEKETNVDKP